MPVLAKLKNKKLLVVRDDWIQKKVFDVDTIVFNSPNQNDQPNFAMRVSYYFKATVAACYEARLLKECGE